MENGYIVKLKGCEQPIMVGERSYNESNHKKDWSYL